MKLSIEWHKNCLLNNIGHAERAREEANRAVRIADECDRKNLLLKAQIELAEKEGKDGFDSEKYAIKRLVGL